jgi:hypothetical protein
VMYVTKMPEQWQDASEIGVAGSTFST